MIKTKDIGDIGEKVAADLLKSKKFKIIERNLHLSHNELDIVAISKAQGLILFVEVKTRSVNADLYSPFGTPGSAVTMQKRKRTIEAARAYLAQKPEYQSLQPRLDVIEVYLSKNDHGVLNINHIENAFGA